MEKIFVTKEGKEVKYGDVVTFENTEECPHGVLYQKYEITLNKDTEESLIVNGVIKVKGAAAIPTTESIIKELAERYDCTEDEVIEFLESVYEMSMQAFYNIVFKRVAIAFSKNYKLHIGETKQAFMIYPLDMSIGVTNDTSAYDMFAMFRTKKDASVAIRIADEILDIIFGEDEQED